MRGHCGLLDRANPCRYRHRMGAAVVRGRLRPSDLLFARRVDALKREMQRFSDAGEVFRSHPEVRAPSRVVDAVVPAVA